jgi:hypothetical protein
MGLSAHNGIQVYLLKRGVYDRKGILAGIYIRIDKNRISPEEILAP